MARKRTAFVLGGGGSLGANQVGMLRALFERGIAPDLIVGVSVGSLNGAFLASRPPTVETTDGLAEIWRSDAREGLFSFTARGLALSIAGRGDHFASPTGLRRILAKSLQFTRVESAATPLHIIATDLASGQEQRLSHGDALRAVLASAAVPGVLPPVPWAGLTLVDGGMANNTPIAHAIELGAERVYLLLAGNPSSLKETPKGMMQMAAHWTGLLHVRQGMEDIELFRDQTELVVLPPPYPQDVSPSDFGHSDELAERSYRAAVEWLAAPNGAVGRVPDTLVNRIELPSPRPEGRAEPARDRGVVAFVLSGGGSLAAGQAGMLRALYERDVTPDLIVGSSFGALNGALIASRPQTTETALWVADIWRTLGRRDLFPLDPFTLAKGLSGRQNYGVSPRGIERVLERHLELGRLEVSPIPLHVVATELLSGEETEISSGDATTAVLASSAFPALFPPVRIGSETLIAGGVVDNSPIGRAVAHGATTVYVLPTGHACSHSPPPRGLIPLLFQWGTVAHSRQLRSEIERFRDQVRLIVMPPLCPQDVHSFDFSRPGEVIDRSYAAAKQHLDGPGDPAGRIPRAFQPHPAAQAEAVPRP